MARRIKEIKNFNIGLVTNADSREVPDEGAIYSDNIDPNASGGVLKGYKKDRLKGEMDWVNILSAASGTGGANYTKITCSTTSHNVTNGAKVKIVGTTNYNGYWTASSTSGASFDINTAYISSESATIITGVTATAADPTVFTKEGHTLATGDTVELSGFNEMTEVNGLRGVVTNLTANTFEVNGVAADPAETTGGTVTKIGGVASTNTGQVKLQTSDTYARLRFDSGTKVDMGGSISVNVTDITVGNGALFKRNEIIAIGTGVFKINNIVGNILYTGGTWYGTFNGESAPFSNDATVYKTSSPIAIESYLDINDSANVRENIILFNESGRIDGIEDFTASDTADTIGAGINTTHKTKDFSNFPLYIPNISNNKLSIVNKFGNYFIGTGSKNAAMFLGKAKENSLIVGDTIFLTQSALGAPNSAASSVGFTKILNYEFTDATQGSNPLSSNFMARFTGQTRRLQIAFIKGTPFLYIIGGDTGKIHITQELDYNVEAIAKVVSTIKGIKVWVYRMTGDSGDGEGASTDNEDVTISPGHIDCLEIFDLDGDDLEDIDLSEEVTHIGLPVTVHQTIDCRWGGTSTTWTNTNSAYATDGYESRPAYQDPLRYSWIDTTPHNIDVYISDILETVDGSRRGMLWLLASPKIGYETSVDPEVSYMRGAIDLEDDTGGSYPIMMPRFIWASWSKADNSEAIDGDIETGASSIKYFTDKSMPVHHMVDQYASDTDFASGMSRRQRGFNGQGLTLQYRLPKRSIGTTTGTAHTPIAKVGSSNQWTNYGQYQKQIVGGTGSGGDVDGGLAGSGVSTTAGIEEDKWNTGQLVTGGSFWYLPNNTAPKVNKASSNTHSADHSFRAWATYMLVNVDGKRGQSSAYEQWSNRKDCLWGESSSITNEPGDDNGIYIKSSQLKFAPLENSLIDVTDLYPGVDHVVSCLVHVHQGAYIESMYQTLYHDDGDQQSLQWNSHSGYDLVGMPSRTIMWTTNGHPNNTGALYINSNSYGFVRTPGTNVETDPDTYTADLAMYDNFNLSTLCYDNTEMVVRTMKLIPLSVHPKGRTDSTLQEFISISRNYNQSMYQKNSWTSNTNTVNDSGLSHSAIWISTRYNEHSRIIGIRLSTLPEGGNAIKGSVRQDTITLNEFTDGDYGSDSGLGGYSNNEGTITDSSFIDNANATDAHQLYPSNHSAMVQCNPSWESQGPENAPMYGLPWLSTSRNNMNVGQSNYSYVSNNKNVGAATSAAWFNDGTGHVPQRVIPRGAGCFNFWDMEDMGLLGHLANLATSHAFYPTDGNSKKFPILKKYFYNGWTERNSSIIRIDNGNIRSGEGSSVLLETEPLFLAPSTFQYINAWVPNRSSNWDIIPDGSMRYMGSTNVNGYTPREYLGNAINTGYSKYVYSAINTEDKVSQIFSRADFPGGGALGFINSPIIVSPSFRTPLNSTGNPGNLSGSVLNRWGKSWWRLLLFNRTGENKMYSATMGVYSSTGAVPYGAGTTGGPMSDTNYYGLHEFPWRTTSYDVENNEPNVLDSSPYTKLIPVIESQLKESAPYQMHLTYSSYNNYKDTANGNSANFPNDYIKKYRLSIEYDGTQDSTLSGSFIVAPNLILNDDGTQKYPTEDFHRMYIKMLIPKDMVSERVTAVILWRQGLGNKSHDGELHYKVGKKEFVVGQWNDDVINGIHYWEATIIDGASGGGTYDSATQTYSLAGDPPSGLKNEGDYQSWSGISEFHPETSLNYGISAVANDYLFVSDIGHIDISKGQYKVARSLKGKYSMFDWQDSIITLNDTVTALKGYSNKLYIFTKKQVIRVNPDELATEDILDGFGCGNSDAVVSTEYGMFFGDKSHAYVHDGSSIKIISYPIENDDFSGESNGWQDKITDTNFKTYFFSKTNLVAFVFEKTAPTKLIRQRHGAFTYHVLKQRWDYREFYLDGTSGLNTQPAMGELLFQSKIDDRIYYFSGPTNGIYTSDISTLISEWGGDSVDDNFSWVSKDMTMDADNVDKRFVKLKIQANRELNTTPTVYIDDVAVTLTSVATNEWRINQKGKKIKVKLSSSSSTVTPSNETTTIFSMGIIYRSTKVK